MPGRPPGRAGGRLFIFLISLRMLRDPAKLTSFFFFKSKTFIKKKASKKIKRAEVTKIF